MAFLKKAKQQSRNPRVSYKKQQSYHYSSRRSAAGGDLNRQTTDSVADKPKMKPMGSFLQNLPTFLAIGVVLIGVFYLLTLSTTPRIVVTNDNAKTQLISTEGLREKAKQELSQNILNRLKLTFNEERVVENLLKLSPEITSAEIKISPLRHNPQIKVVFSEPSVLLSNGSKLYVIGSDGRALADVTSSKNGFKIDSLPLVQDESGIEINVGRIALTSEQVSYVKQVNFQAEQAKLKVISLNIKAGGFQLDVKYGGLEYLVKYNFFEDARKSSGVFLATKKKLDDEGSAPKEYIDVRVPERAYVK